METNRGGLTFQKPTISNTYYPGVDRSAPNVDSARNPPWHRDGLAPVQNVGGSSSWNRDSRPDHWNSGSSGPSVDNLRDPPWNRRPDGPSIGMTGSNESNWANRPSSLNPTNWNDKPLHQTQSSGLKPNTYEDITRPNTGSNLFTRPERPLAERSTFPSWNNKPVGPLEKPLGLNTISGRPGPNWAGGVRDFSTGRFIGPGSEYRNESGPNGDLRFQGQHQQNNWKDQPGRAPEALMSSKIQAPWRDTLSGPTDLPQGNSVRRNNWPDDRNMPNDRLPERERMWRDNNDRSMWGQEKRMNWEQDRRLREREENFNRNRDKLDYKAPPRSLMEDPIRITPMPSMEGRKRARSPEDRDVWSRLEPDRAKRPRTNDEGNDVFGGWRHEPPTPKHDDLRDKLSKRSIRNDMLDSTFNRDRVYELYIVPRRKIVKITPRNFELIEDLLCKLLYPLTSLKNNDHLPQLRFDGLELKDERTAVIRCMNRESAVWLLSKSLVCKKLKLRIIYPEDTKYSTLISFGSRTRLNIDILKENLKIQNPGLEICSWNRGTVKSGRKAFIYSFYVDGHSLRYFHNHNWKLFLGFEKICVKRVSRTNESLDPILF